MQLWFIYRSVSLAPTYKCVLYVYVCIYNVYGYVYLWIYVLYHLSVDRWIDGHWFNKVLWSIIDTIDKKEKSFTNGLVLAVVSMTDSILASAVTTSHPQFSKATSTKYELCWGIRFFWRTERHIGKFFWSHFPNQFVCLHYCESVD